MPVLSQSILHHSLHDAASPSRSRTMQVLIVVIVTVFALEVAPGWSSPVDGRHLLEELAELSFEAGSGGPQFQLLHWSHPQSPLHIPRLSVSERFKYAVQTSKEKAAGLSREIGMVPSANSSGEDLVYNLTRNNLYVRPYGVEYGIEITIGTPPQTFSGIADTGSDLVWVQCSPCSDCIAQPDPLFNPAQSSTYEGVSCNDTVCLLVESSCNKTCQYDYGYGAGTTIGSLARETISLSTITGKPEISKDFVFGCGHDEEFNSLYNQDGIVGLGRGPLSLTSQLGGLYGNKFSYCLVSFSDSSNTSSPLLFGNSSVPKVATQYTPMVQNPNHNDHTFYYIGLKGINVDGVPLDIPSDAFEFLHDGRGGVVSDSGTPFTFLVDVAYNPLLSTMQSLVKYPAIPGSNITIGLDLCYNLSSVPSPKFPNVTFVFDGMSLDLPQENVFLLIPGANSSTCMTIVNSGPLGAINIFGSVQQKNFQILYDREANRYGFAKVQCDRLSWG